MRSLGYIASMVVAALTLNACATGMSAQQRERAMLDELLQEEIIATQLVEAPKTVEAEVVFSRPDVRVKPSLRIDLSQYLMTEAELNPVTSPNEGCEGKCPVSGVPVVDEVARYVQNCVQRYKTELLPGTKINCRVAGDSVYGVCTVKIAGKTHTVMVKSSELVGGDISSAYATLMSSKPKLAERLTENHCNPSVMEFSELEAIAKPPTTQRQAAIGAYSF
ncbi:hypothetical protein HN587_07685 [Candidatus Woesearchaeota archaeon]|jgi:hypothetical protein|nr:hypothetical protein [Candidatus Woesearchaeota archaeon]